jgi:hypothetical protein
VDWGSLHEAVTTRVGHAGGRGVVVARKPVKVGGAKDARKVDTRMSQGAKHDPDEVPVRAVLPGEADPYGWVERTRVDGAYAGRPPPRRVRRRPNTFFAEHGLFSLEVAHVQFVHALRRAH